MHHAKPFQSQLPPVIVQLESVPGVGRIANKANKVRSDVLLDKAKIIALHLWNITLHEARNADRANTIPDRLRIGLPTPNLGMPCNLPMTEAR